MPSRLVAASSAYLRSATHQPVDWYPWGPEPFARAQREGKPVLLDVGAVWCHWCHVMDRESYESPAIAELLARDWICIKVDRDERPDVDARYQRAVQAITGQGGWPLTGFLTPEGEVFYGGTYFPPDGAHGRPGFATVLTELARVYRDDRGKLVEQAAMIRRHLAEHAAESRPGSVPADLLASAADAMARLFDFRYGGFGTQPKFPYPTACELLLARWRDSGETWPREMVDRTLTAMARGGMCDQIGGGFHRYSVDARWVVPHFEKMTYDNAALLKLYAYAAASWPAALADAAGRTQSTEGPAATVPRSTTADQEPGLYRQTVEGIVQWVTSLMADPAGGYYASQDADAGPQDDGDYFTWTVDEVRAAVSPSELAVLTRRFDIEPQGEMQHDPRRNVLWVRRSVDEIARELGIAAAEVAALIESGSRALAEARAARTAPFVDRAIYTGWSAMMASAMLAAGAVLARSDLDHHAVATLERLWRDVVEPHGGARHAIGNAVAGILDDQVHLAAAALDAYEATGGRVWLDRAAALLDHVWATYRAADGGLLDRAPGDDAGMLSHAVRPVLDAPTPSPNGVAVTVLSRLAEHTGAARYRDRRDELLAAFGGGLADLGLHGAALLLGADWALHPATHVVVVTAAEPAGDALRRAARSAYRPRKVLTLLAPGAASDHLPPPVRAMVDGTAPRAYVCIGTECLAPVDTADALLQLLGPR
jgi:uncharacterized protein YyaL (SSP411 family)